MSMTYKGAHYDGLDGKNGDDEAGITRLLFLVSFSLNQNGKSFSEEVSSPGKYDLIVWLAFIPTKLKPFVTFWVLYILCSVENPTYYFQERN